jgi:hypothetical protein
MVVNPFADAEGGGEVGDERERAPEWRLAVVGLVRGKEQSRFLAARHDFLTGAGIHGGRRVTRPEAAINGWADFLPHSMPATGGPYAEIDPGCSVGPVPVSPS